MAGVWAFENTREAIYEALERKEVFATSGTRIKVRFFGGWNFDSLNFSNQTWIKDAYNSGIPMGGNLSSSDRPESLAPSFVIQAIKDSDGANLDRVQVIKGWLDEAGMPQDKIYNIAWSDGRIKDEDGNIPVVGSTVDTLTASYTNEL